MLSENFKENSIILGGITLKPIIILTLKILPQRILQNYLINILVSMAKFNWKIGYLLTLYLNQFVKDLYSKKEFLISKTRFGLLLKVPTSDNHFLWRLVGLYHPNKLLDTLTMELRGVRHICEIGTHLGELSTWFKFNNPKAYYSGFELHPIFFSYVTDSFKLNNFENYEILNSIVGPRNIVTKGYCDFNSLVMAFPELHVGGCLEHKFFTKEIKDIDEIEIPLKEKLQVDAINLVEHFQGKSSPDFYFMDIEGCEVYALPMIIELNRINNIKAKIVFEIHHYAYSGKQAFEMKNLLIKNGYKLYSIDNRHLFCV